MILLDTYLQTYVSLFLLAREAWVLSCVNKSWKKLIRSKEYSKIKWNVNFNFDMFYKEACIFCDAIHEKSFVGIVNHPYNMSLNTKSNDYTLACYECYSIHYAARLVFTWHKHKIFTFLNTNSS